MSSTFREKDVEIRKDSKYTTSSQSIDDVSIEGISDTTSTETSDELLSAESEDE